MPRKFIDVYDLKEHTEEMKSYIGDSASSQEGSYTSVQELETSLTVTHPHRSSSSNSNVDLDDPDQATDAERTAQEFTFNLYDWWNQFGKDKDNLLVTRAVPCKGFVDQLYATHVKLLRDAFRKAVDNGDITSYGSRRDTDLNVVGTLKMLSYIPQDVAYEYVSHNSEGTETGRYKFLYNCPKNLWISEAEAFYSGKGEGLTGTTDWMTSSYWNSVTLRYVNLGSIQIVDGTWIKSQDSVKPAWYPLDLETDSLLSDYYLDSSNEWVRSGDSENAYMYLTLLNNRSLSIGDYRDNLLYVPVMSSNVITNISTKSVLAYGLDDRTQEYSGDNAGKAIFKYCVAGSDFVSQYSFDATDLYRKLKFSVATYKIEDESSPFNGRCVLCLNGGIAGDSHQVIDVI